MSNTVAYSRLATFSLNPNTESYPAEYRVYSWDNNVYTFIESVTFATECTLENNIVTFDLDLGDLYSGQTYYYSLTAFKDGQESSFSEEYRLDVPTDSDGDSNDSDGDSTDSDGDSTDATVEYSVQVTLDPKLYSIPDPVGYEVCYDTVSRLDGDCELSKEVDNANCRLEGEFVTCDLKIEFEPGGTYFLSVKAVGDLNECAFSNEMSVTLPKDSDEDSTDSDEDSTDSDEDSTDSEGDPTDSEGDSTDSDGDSTDSDGDSTDSDEDSTDSDEDSTDSDEDSTDSDGDSTDSEGDPTDSEGDSTDATVEYSVQVTLDPELYSITDPEGYEVFYDVYSRGEWDSDYDDYAFSQEVSIANCRLDGEFVTCDLKIEFKPGWTYYLSVKAFDNRYESDFSNEMSFTPPEDTDFDGIPDMGESVYGTDPCDPDSDNDGISDGRELELGTDPLHDDSLAEYLVQVTVDLVAASISYPALCEVLLNSDNDEFSKEVDIDACWFEEECMICDIKLEMKPGGTYGISTRIFDDNNESVISNEIPFKLPIYFDY